MIAISDASIADALQRVKGSLDRVELVDGREEGLRLRAGERGARWSVLVRSREGGRVRIPLGSWPAVSIAEARTGARSVRLQMGYALGTPDRAFNVGELLEIYRRRKLSQLKRGEGTARTLTAALAGVLSRDAPMITRRDIGLIVDNIADRAPIQANRALAYMKAFFAWCVGRGYLEANPAASVAKPSREATRSRAPSLAELVEIWDAAAVLGYPFGDIVRLLMLTAARRDEVAKMQAFEIEISDGRANWIVPAARSKNGRAIRTALPALAQRLVEAAMARRPLGSKWIFTTSGVTPVSGWSKAKKRLDELIAKKRARLSPELGSMSPWRLHDLRRSFATLACDTLLIDAAVADRCLNHVGASTTSTISRIYARNEMYEQRRAALQCWADLIENAVARRSAAE